MFISIEYRYAFVHIPKTAGEWLYLMLRDASKKDDLLSIGFWGQDHKKHIDTTHIHQGILHDYISSKLYSECVSFCVVRNPYNRFYSAFGDLPSKAVYSKSVAHRQPKAQRFWNHKYPAYDAPHKTDDASTKRRLFHTFCNLVDKFHITTDVITKHNIHLIPQHCFVYKPDENGRPAVRNVSHVLRFEHLGEDLVALFDRYRFPHAQHPRRHYNGSYRIRFDTADAQRNRKSYLQYYTPETIALVNQWYTKDFEYFGFEKLNPMQFAKVDKTIVSIGNAPFSQNAPTSHCRRNTSKSKRVNVNKTKKRYVKPKRPVR